MGTDTDALHQGTEGHRLPMSLYDYWVPLLWIAVILALLPLYAAMAVPPWIRYITNATFLSLLLYSYVSAYANYRNRTLQARVAHALSTVNSQSQRLSNPQAPIHQAMSAIAKADSNDLLLIAQDGSVVVCAADGSSGRTTIHDLPMRLGAALPHRLEEELWTSLRGRAPLRTVFKSKKGNSSSTEVLTADPLMGADGEFVGMVCVLRDISDEVERSGAISRSRTRAKLEAEHLGSIIRVIREPVTNLVQATTMLRNRTGQAAERGTDASAALTERLLAAALTSAERVGQAMSGIGVYLNSINHTAKASVVDLSEVVEHCCGQFLLETSSAEMGNRSLKRKLAPGLTCSLDPNALQSTLQAILHNAVVHTPDDARIRVSTFADDHAAMAVIRVVDDGGGAPANVLRMLGQPFQLWSGSRTGAGLGLATANNLVTTMGGRLTFDEARPGSVRPGLLVEVRLPLASPQGNS